MVSYNHKIKKKKEVNALNFFKKIITMTCKKKKFNKKQLLLKQSNIKK